MYRLHRAQSCSYMYLASEIQEDVSYVSVTTAVAPCVISVSPAMTCVRPDLRDRCIHQMSSSQPSASRASRASSRDVDNDLTNEQYLGWMDERASRDGVFDVEIGLWNSWTRKERMRQFGLHFIHTRQYACHLPSTLISILYRCSPPVFE
jgi:hypothetical protein